VRQPNHTDEGEREMDGDEAQAQAYRDRAIELRGIAASTWDEKSRGIIARLAEQYDVMAVTMDAIAATDRKLASRNSN
jgi:hypothetical protein